MQTLKVSRARVAAAYVTVGVMVGGIAGVTAGSSLAPPVNRTTVVQRVRATTLTQVLGVPSARQIDGGAINSQLAGSVCQLWDRGNVTVFKCVKSA